MPFQELSSHAMLKTISMLLLFPNLDFLHFVKLPVWFGAVFGSGSFSRGSRISVLSVSPTKIFFSEGTLDHNHKISPPSHHLRTHFLQHQGQLIKVKRTPISASSKRHHQKFSNENRRSESKRITPIPQSWLTTDEAPKQQKMSLGAFLADESLGSWADEMEDMPTIPSSGNAARAGYGRDNYGDRDTGYGSKYGANRDSAFPPRQQLPIPDKPPYTAHVGNLSFDVNDEELGRFFADCEVTNIRLVRDRMDDKPKGFGYVEFKTAEGLIKALDLSGTQLAGRDVRVNVAEPPKDRGDDRTAGEWRRTGPLPALETRDSHQGPRRGGDRGDRFHSGGSEAGDRPERRPSAFDDSRVRNLDSWERKGPLTPLSPTGSTGGDRPRSRAGERRNSPAPFDGPRRGAPGMERAPSARGGAFMERAPSARGAPPMERALSAADRDNEWRRGARPDAPAKSSPVSPIIPHSRPKLELKKRSEVAVETAASPSASSKASPFGAARPIDTSAKLKEIEEKLAQQAAEKKKKDDEAREKRLAKEKEEKERGAQTPTAPRNFDNFRRGSAAVSNDGNDAAPSKSASGSVAGDKTPAAVEETASPVAQPPQEEEEGWSTVAPTKRGRGAYKAQLSS
ncbi:hypothetical protein BJ508DRAFT_308040 [Ascobolus immersus RN42]|uniref:RRM domain-containing protein n=1 Tax=Ascobolus immersus RN42 TaxID=1160509 RepID=A0A3N4I6J6_ASCIM|nr:hypothetical protein BJ508DRAFT_308040 [Ascobolus immersus RN42]